MGCWFKCWLMFLFCELRKKHFLTQAVPDWGYAPMVRVAILDSLAWGKRSLQSNQPWEQSQTVRSHVTSIQIMWANQKRRVVVFTRKVPTEMLQDVRDYDAALEVIEQGKDELIPARIVYAILDGENPIRVWREHRGLTQQQLAEGAGISTPYLSQLESGKRSGSTEVLSGIAKALDLTLDDLVQTD